MKNLEKIIKKYSEINHNEENFEIGDFVQLPTGVQGHIKKKYQIFATIKLLDKFVEVPTDKSQKPISSRICNYNKLIKLKPM